MTEVPDPSQVTPPVTGHAEIDAALAGLELGPDVHSHHDEIKAALDVIQAVLREPGSPRR